MTVLIIAEAIAISLLSVLVAGLLRSHARLLAALHQAGIPVDQRGKPGYQEGRVPLPLLSQRAGGAQRGGGTQRANGPGRSAPDLAGTTPGDESVSIAVSGTTVDTLLGFLSGGCTSCADLWAEIPGAEKALPPATRLVVVTRGADKESPARLRRLSPPGASVVMSGDAWEDYHVPGAPYFVLVSGQTGTVVGEGSAPTWPEVLSLLGAASDDARLRTGRRRDSDAELAAAGFVPGDPRLFHPPIGAHPDPGELAG